MLKPINEMARINKTKFGENEKKTKINKKYQTSKTK